MHGGVPSPSFQLRSHSLELPSSSPDVGDFIIASHRILLEESFGSCGDLASLGASGAADVARESDDDSAASGRRSPSCSVDGATFYDALDAQVRVTFAQKVWADVDKQKRLRFLWVFR